MDLGDLLKMGASMIQNDSQESTTGLSSDLISGALGSLLGSKDGGLDLSSILGNLSNGNLGDVVASWIGSGENQSIDPDGAAELIGNDKVEEFAEKLGVDVETAKNSLSEVLPNLVDQATNEDSSLAGELLEKVGGVGGLMDLAGKFMKS